MYVLLLQTMLLKLAMPFALNNVSNISAALPVMAFFYSLKMIQESDKTMQLNNKTELNLDYICKNPMIIIQINLLFP